MNANETQTFFLAAGEVLSLDVASDAVGTITRLADSAGEEPYSPVAIAGADLSFGPYGGPRRYTAELSVGSLEYSTAAADPANKADSSDVEGIGTEVDALQLLLTSGAGVPVDYTDGDPVATGEGTAPKGSLYIDTTNGFVYRNSGTVAQPAWTKLADVVV